MLRAKSDVFRDIAVPNSAPHLKVLYSRAHEKYEVTKELGPMPKLRRRILGPSFPTPRQHYRKRRKAARESSWAAQ